MSLGQAGWVAYDFGVIVARSVKADNPAQEILRIGLGGNENNNHFYWLIARVFRHKESLMTSAGQSYD